MSLTKDTVHRLVRCTFEELPHQGLAAYLRAHKKCVFCASAEGLVLYRFEVANGLTPDPHVVCAKHDANVQAHVALGRRAIETGIRRRQRLGQTPGQMLDLLMALGLV